MYEPQHYDSPPVYSPKYSLASPPPSLYLPRSIHHQSAASARYAPRGSSLPDGYYYTEERPQHFYRWFSPPGFVKTFQGATVLMCFLIFAFVASTLVWDVSGFGYGGAAAGAGVAGAGPGYYGGSYGYGGSYMTPQSAKAAMISMAAVNFLVSLGFLVASFSRSRAMRGCRFYLTVFVCDIILAVLQGIINIIFVIGVNPMSQSSQSMLYNPMLMMCQNRNPMYSQYLHHYCYMDPEESVGLVLGMMVVLALSLAAYYAYKTRSKIWRHGKSNIYWDEPHRRHAHSPDLRDWVRPRAQGRECIYVKSSNGERSSAPEQCPPRQQRLRPDPEHQESQREPHPRSAPGGPPRPAAAVDQAESQCETGYTTGGDTGNELDQDHSQLYPVILSDDQRREYKREFDSDLVRYKSLCADMDDVSDQMHKLSRELDALDHSSVKYQGVADEYNRLKDLKRTPDYQAKKKQSKELRQKLFHIKQLVKIYDQGMC
uniref:Zgc:154006 n=1 Tax=Neogobius melanostomus TaxID=47308 RepID=A0A8C6SRG2_9GOBI